MKLCFATHNTNKLHEVQQLLKGTMEVVGLKDIGCNYDIPETGQTLDENSSIKAKYVRDNYQIDCFADDTGLEVEALNGEPGVYSARYAGDDRDNNANMSLLIGKLASHENKKARFRTVITLLKDGQEHQFDGVVEGTITSNPRGSQGFGYDPIFVPDGYDTTFAEMELSAKNKISHRARGMQKLITFLKSTNQ